MKLGFFFHIEYAFLLDAHFRNSHRQCIWQSHVDLQDLQLMLLGKPHVLISHSSCGHREQGHPSYKILQDSVK